MAVTRARGADYNHKITVIVPTETQDAVGQIKHNWQPGTPVMSIYMAIEPEFRPTDIYVETSATHHYEDKVWFRTRYGNPFDKTNMRLRDEHNQDWEILSIQDPTGRNREIRLLCRQAPQ